MDSKRTHLIWFVNFILLWYRKAIVLIQYNSTDIRFLSTVYCREYFGDGNRKLVECRYRSMRQT